MFYNTTYNYSILFNNCSEYYSITFYVGFIFYLFFFFFWISFYSLSSSNWITKTNRLPIGHLVKITNVNKEQSSAGVSVGHRAENKARVWPRVSSPVRKHITKSVCQFTGPISNLRRCSLKPIRSLDLDPSETEAGKVQTNPSKRSSGKLLQL